ncbi:MAG TPA: DUF2911 domain-containing protein [Thermoanaerobaculia bacterium]|nr:DUF2911 domain-containing protein [Thermoanaerobaculia bacterium]
MRKLALLSLLFALPLFAQVKYPQASPHAVVTQAVGTTDVTIDYHRPAVKGRPIWGALVPYDKVWRTGANEATTITFSDDVTIDGKPLGKGTYELFTIPGKTDWTIVFNNASKQWGAFSYDQTKDALRVTEHPHMAAMTELMEFTFPSVSADYATVEIRWERVAVPFTIGTGSTQKALAAARAAIAAAKPDDWRTPFVAASFATNAGEMADARTWIEQSIKVKPTYQNLYQRAQMEAKAGHRDAAVKDAEAALAVVGDNAEMKSEIEKSISEWKAKK